METKHFCLLHAVLAAGGSDNNGILASAELFDPSINQWTATGAMTNARTDYPMVVLPGGTGRDSCLHTLRPCFIFAAPTRLPDACALPSAALAAGGQGNSASLASAELYDPSTGQWTPTGAMTSSRTSFQMVVLPGGKGQTQPVVCCFWEQDFRSRVHWKC